MGEAARTRGGTNGKSCQDCRICCHVADEPSEEIRNGEPRTKSRRSRIRFSVLGSPFSVPHFFASLFKSDVEALGRSVRRRSRSIPSCRPTSAGYVTLLFDRSFGLRGRAIIGKTVQIRCGAAAVIGQAAISHGNTSSRHWTTSSGKAIASRQEPWAECPRLRAESQKTCLSRYVFRCFGSKPSKRRRLVFSRHHRRF